MTLPGFTAEAAINRLSAGDYTKRLSMSSRVSLGRAASEGPGQVQRAVFRRPIRIGWSLFSWKQLRSFVCRWPANATAGVAICATCCTDNADASRAKWHALKELELSWKAVALLAGGTETTERK